MSDIKRKLPRVILYGIHDECERELAAAQARIAKLEDMRKETTMTTGYKLRDDFEAWVKNQRMLNRYTEPGYADEYDHSWTRGAWAAWKECHERAKPAASEAPQITREQWDDATRGLGTKA